MIVIIDYGLGNLGSILNMLRKVGAPAIISSNPSDIEKADKLILPGVGAFDHGMSNLRQLNFIPLLDQRILRENTPLLSICLGMQLMTKSSEEGTVPGLGWIDAETVKFQYRDPAAPLKTPHMGWNTVEIVKPSLLFREMPPEPRFYFVHSYHVLCRSEEDVLTRTTHGISFVSSLQHKNIIGVQFHPEKSHKFGMALLSNFALTT